MYERNAPALLEESSQARQVLPATPGAPVPKQRPRRLNPAANLSAGMLENNRMTRPKRAIDFVLSIMAHSALVAVAVLVPLYFTNAIDLSQVEATYLVAPAPPPPPPPPPAAGVVHAFQRPRMLLNGSTLYAPRVIPKVVAQIKDLGTTPQMTEGVPGGVPGGIPGGQLGGVIGGILGGSTSFVAPTPPPPPKPVVHVGPYRVGGQVQAPMLVYRVQPTYPVLAKETRVQGDVALDCVIDKQGNVTEIKVVSGPSLLISAAMNAVSQWKYSPTLLNRQPVAVELLATVHFTLNS
jgi:periplasmic protein TonB